MKVVRTDVTGVIGSNLAKKLAHHVSAASDSDVIGLTGPGGARFAERSLGDSRAMMNSGWEKLAASASVLFRFGLGLSFLSAVADRLGWWGAFGQPGVAWGDFARFVAYTGKLNPFLPGTIIPSLAIFVTCLEAVLGLLLLAGWHTRISALASGILLLVFGLAMTLALGIKAPLNFSVFSAAGGSLLLAVCPSFPFSVDQLRRQR